MQPLPGMELIDGEKQHGRRSGRCVNGCQCPNNKFCGKIASELNPRLGNWSASQPTKLQSCNGSRTLFWSAYAAHMWGGSRLPAPDAADSILALQKGIQQAQPIMNSALEKLGQATARGTNSRLRCSLEDPWLLAVPPGFAIRKKRTPPQLVRGKA